MVKVEVLQDFTLARFDELKNIKRARQEKRGWLYTGDTFECSNEIADYLTGNNPIKKAVVKVLEIIPEEEPKAEVVAEEPKPTKKSKKKKK